MCHIALIRYLCAHRNLFQLHCDEGSDLLCPPGKRDLINRYHIGYTCVDCFNSEWDKKTDDRLSLIDDSLADLARRSTLCNFPAALQKELTQKMAEKDAMQEKESLEERDLQIGRIEGAVRLAKAHAGVYWSFKYEGSGSKREERVRGYRELRRRRRRLAGEERGKIGKKREEGLMMMMKTTVMMMKLGRGVVGKGKDRDDEDKRY
ncbi:hypothetical protein QBC44DRAFT_390878 [Cladorrhinum sp. PSN332]|nr:hypothetical protein QBC44DRAFT_390878 [Cladorrhinum sp. PSN332]